MRRTILATATAMTLAVPLVPAVAAQASVASPARAGAAANVNAVQQLLSQNPAAVLPAKKKAKKKRVKKIRVSSNRKAVHKGGTVKLTGTIKPKMKAHVAYQQRRPGAKSWRSIGAEVTGKGGHSTLKAALSQSGAYRFRLITKNKKSASISVRSTSPTPPVPPVPPGPNPPKPKTISVNWPDGNPLQVDKQYNLPVVVKPALNVQVRLQEKTGSGWDDMYGGTANTGKDGKTTVILSQPDAGTSNLRVRVVNYPITSDAVSKDFDDSGDTLYNIPMQLPKNQGVLVKAQEFPMTYPKLKLPDPVTPGQTLVMPQIGTPAAGPPTCVTDDSPREDCQIPGKQYRFMYTTERWYPNKNADGGGSVQGGSQGATALVMVPPDVEDNAPVVAWAHPTLGQPNACSVTRGTSQIDIPGTDKKSPGGQDMNLTDMIFFLDQMLEKGYIVVMPDYLGIAVNGPTANQKTYIVGPQEARDVFYAVDALQTNAKADKGWPGLPQADNRFITVGHSQGGHAAIWSGIGADELGKETNQRLKGVVAVAPATDLNKMVDAQWNQQANWVIGPEVIQTWLGYLPEFAFKNITISDAAVNNLTRYEEYCTTQAFVASNEFFPVPDNPDDPANTPFMKNPNAPANQQAFYNWSQVFAGQTPVIEQGKDNSFPKDMPLELVSGTADQVVLSQVNAAFQESFCDGGADMTAYWTPVATGIANSPATKNTAFQAADHLNVLAFPWTDNMTGDPANPQYQLVGGSILEFADDRFSGKAVTEDCGDRQKVHKFTNPLGNEKDSWYVFPRLDWSTPTKPKPNPADPKFYQTNGQVALPAPAHPTSPKDEGINPAPALGTVDIKSVTQTGCGFQFKVVKNKYNVIIGYDSNPECYQWGLYPYGELIYDDAEVGKTWGSYPFTPQAPGNVGDPNNGGGKNPGKGGLG